MLRLRCRAADLSGFCRSVVCRLITVHAVSFYHSARLCTVCRCFVSVLADVLGVHSACCGSYPSVSQCQLWILVVVHHSASCGGSALIVHPVHAGVRIFCFLYSCRCDTS